MQTIDTHRSTAETRLHSRGATALIVLTKVAGLLLGIVFAAGIFFASIFGDCLSDNGLNAFDCETTNPLLTALWIGLLVFFGSAALMVHQVPTVIAGIVYFPCIAVTVLLGYIASGALILDQPGFGGFLLAIALVIVGMAMGLGYLIAFLRHQAARAS